MKKSIILLLLVALLLTPTVAQATEEPEQGSDIRVYLDGMWLDKGVTPVIRNGYTLLPIRSIAEAMGADVQWDETTRTTTLIRAGDEIKLTIGENIAVINGEEVPLEVGAALINGMTMLPLRFVAERFSQIVGYSPEERAIYIAEDMSFDEDGDFVQWMLGCGAILAKVNDLDPLYIGMTHRAWGLSSEYKTTYSSNPLSKSRGRRMLSGSWDCSSREELVELIVKMTLAGHNESFLYDVELINMLSDKEYNELLGELQGIDKFMWPYVKAMGEKWGEVGIGAWDWFRVLHLAGWGYTAGYLELSEAYTLTKPAIAFLKNYFSSWDEATENYMDGYAYWSRTDVTEAGTDYHKRLEIYEDLKSDPATKDILFDPAVWK